MCDACFDRMSTDEFNCFSLIPEEINIEIFSYLSKKDLQSLRLTCKSLNKTISESKSLLSVFKITHSHLDRSLEWIKISNYSHLKLDDSPTKKTNQKHDKSVLLEAMDIMGSNLLKLDINSSECN